VDWQAGGGDVSRLLFALAPEGYEKMTVASSQQGALATESKDAVCTPEEIAMKRRREEWDNEGGAARLPTQADTQAPAETHWRDLADILPPPIMANRNGGTLRCAYNG
jgi:hypothetical protein